MSTQPTDTQHILNWWEVPVAHNIAAVSTFLDMYFELEMADLAKMEIMEADRKLGDAFQAVMTLASQYQKEGRTYSIEQFLHLDSIQALSRPSIVAAYCHLMGIYYDNGMSKQGGFMNIELMLQTMLFAPELIKTNYTCGKGYAFYRIAKRCRLNLPIK